VKTADDALSSKYVSFHGKTAADVSLEICGFISSYNGEKDHVSLGDNFISQR
jgi:hypothetical protein